MKKGLYLLLTLIFLIALAVRFLYFPKNVHFSFDQARDSFSSLEILKGHLKLVGPPSYLSNKIFPGPLIFYIYAPIYFLFNKNPEAASAIFRVWNASGVFLVFAIGSILFNKRVGILTATLFAFSYEESQYSLFLSHQPLAVITVLIFYLGLCLFLFQKKPWGLSLIAAGLGLSIQFHYGFIYLIPILVTCLIFFREKIKSFKITKFFPSEMKWIFLSFLIFLLTVFSFILTEFKYHFLSSLIPEYSNNPKVHFFSGLYFKETIFIVNRFLHDTFLANYKFTPLIGVILVVATIYLLYQKGLMEKGIFLIIWFAFGLSLYILSGVSSYYYSPATSISLLFLASYFIDKIHSSGRILLSSLFIIAIVINNLFSIFTINPNGPNSDMVIQPHMTTSNQKRVLDYVYSKSQGQSFAVGALTIPLNIKVTWDYLFNWYGMGKCLGYF